MRTESSQLETIFSHEGLRGVAALMVALFHVPGHGGFGLWLTQVPWIANAWICVDLFFVLSGFVLFWSYGHRLDSPQAMRGFMIRRFGRLFPLHIATLLLFIVVWFGVQCLKWGMIQYSGTSVGSVAPFAGPEVNLVDFLFHLSLTHGMGFIWTDAFNYPSWSVSLELLMYGVFVVIVAGASSQQSRAIFFSMIAFVAFCHYLVQAVSQPDFVDFFLAERNLYRGLFSFSIGACVAFMRQQYRQPPMYLGILQIGALLTIAFYGAVLIFHGAWLLLGPVLFGGLVYLLSFDRGWFARVLMCRPLIWLGAHSYSIYLLHAIILMAIGAAARHLPEPFSSLAIPVYLVVLLTLSALTYRFIEGPYRERFRQLADRSNGRTNANTSHEISASR